MSRKPWWQRPEDVPKPSHKPARGQDPLAIEPDPDEDDGRQIWWPGYVVVEEDD